MITVATAVCVLFAGWLDRSEPITATGSSDPLRPDHGAGPLGRGRRRRVGAGGTGLLVHAFAGVSASVERRLHPREATICALALCAGAATLVWVRPRLRRGPWTALVTAFVVVDLGIMAITSQLSPPPNDLVAGTTPVQQLMAAHLVPGGRMVNYDPQTYASYPGVPRACPTSTSSPTAVGVGVRIDRERYLRVGDAHPRAGGSRHRPARVGDARAARPARGRDACRSTSWCLWRPATPYRRRPAVPRTIGTDPVLPRGYGADFNDTAYPFYPAPRPPLHAVRRLVVLRRVAGTRRPPSCCPPRAGHGGALRDGGGRRVDALGRAGPGRHGCPRGRGGFRRGRQWAWPCTSSVRCRRSRRSSPRAAAPTSSTAHCPRRSCRGPGSWPGSRRDMRCSRCHARRANLGLHDAGAGSCP